MDTITRLVQAGIRPDCAVEMVAEFRERCDEAGLEQFIQAAEKRSGKQKECAL